MSMDSTLDRETRPRHVSGRRDNADPERETSTTGLLSSLATDIGELLRGEMRLARAEVTEAIDGAKTGAFGIGVGVAVLLAGVLTLIAFLVLGIADWFDLQLWAGALIVGLITTLIGALMVKGGSSKLSAQSLAPTRTQKSLQKDKQLIKEKAL